MRKPIISALILLLVTTPALAKDKSIQIRSAQASNSYSESSTYSPNNAIDGNESTIWAGAKHDEFWWITFELESTAKLSKLCIIWYNRRYSPDDYDVLLSANGSDWITEKKGLSDSINTSAKRDILISSTANEYKYIKLNIHEVTDRFPVIREFKAYETSGVPHLIRFQGVLKDSVGTPLDESKTITFKIYNTEEGGTELWQETQTEVDITDGLLDVELGIVEALDLSFDEQYWLGVTVQGDTEMTPRFKLTSVPYSFVSEQ
jgi:hypothetical protein